MTVRKLKPKQRGAQCSWCNEKAVWRGFMFGKMSCEGHLDQLREWDRRAQQPDYSDAAFFLERIGKP